MRTTFRTITAIGIAAGVALGLAPSASAHGKHRPPAPVTVVASGLAGPYQVSSSGRDLIVTEADAGRVIAINRHRRGSVRTLVSGLGEGAAAGAVRIGNRVFIATAEAGGPPDAPPRPPSPYPGSSVLVASKGRISQFADLLAYELRNNPDGQTQFGPDGAPLDALSNPFSLLAARGGGVLVADGGANVVLRVSASGRVSTFFVPPVVTTGACAGRPNNDAASTGCDPVPTGLAYGPRNTLYVSTLSGEAPGQGRVYVLDARRGTVKKVIGGFTSPTGVAVAPDGTVYVTEALEGQPTSEPGPDFDPSTVGQVVKVSPRGQRTYAQITTPTGIVWTGGKLYSTAWSLGSFFGQFGTGQIVALSPRAFR
ncbi:ScyD/ScyE family protein [Aeromicrobium duanguangcaii]|uniref:ScyD/ScyE family protein n=1 Tax=Aeromicrobium duanguangcaii TaxID=2968086 RepID=A0ABY5KHC7_9ACTN|nr:ScyD/ScyE family protein [Aeromicrobium duanguangcaii]MCD9153027.1 ScyD/ScyE family protein [Aeromicrobium duanguangcaii]MCL3836977.1 ScyD/ScyE family protein [Aeromicrobium duanguangcaii]UUI69867.1 ScyD/ScyE family protein [Aeromicrobium duanguangcaii]